MSSANKPAEEARPAALQWDDSRMATVFANVVNVQSTREQVDLFFGLNSSWNAGGEGGPVKVDLSNRIILSPYAAKRMWTILGNVLKEYETRHGALDLER